MKKKIGIFLISMMLVTSFVIIFPTEKVKAIGNTLFVGGSGDGNYTSIQDAINDANSDDTVFVYNGTYYENVIVDKSINLIGEDKNTTIIDAQGYGTVVMIEKNYVNISCFTITHCGSGSPNSGVRIKTKSNQVKDCIIIGHGWNGFLIGGSGFNLISNNIIKNCDADGFWINSKNNTIYNNDIVNCGIGITIHRDNNLIYSNDISIGYFYYGVVLTGTYGSCDNNTIKDNKIFGSAIGLRLDAKSCNNIIQNNIIKKIYVIENSNNNKIFHNTFLGSYRYDKCINSWDNGYPSGGNYWTVFNDPEEGAWDNNSDGIVDSPFHILDGNNQDNYPLMYPWYPTHPDTVYVDDDYDENTVGWGYDRFNRIQYGINEVPEEGTVFVFNGIYFENVDIVKDNINLVGENKNTTIIDADTKGAGIAISNPTSYLSISKFTIRNAHGSGIIFMDWTSGTNVMHNTISECIVYNSSRNITDPNYNWIDGYGIFLGGHDAHIENNSIINCEVYNNDMAGITIRRSAYDNIKNNRIIGCRVYNNGYKGWLGASSKAGISVTSHNNRYIQDTIFSDCEVYDNAGDGFFTMDYSSGTQIVNNLIYNNGGYGINISGTQHSDIIYHNNLINNVQNAYDSGSNSWDNGYPSGGNYWSDYTGTDSNADGIGDTPYDISGGSNQDLYPLMHPYGSVINLDTGKIFLTIQSAIDDSDTLTGHTIYVRKGTYYENVEITKDSIKLIGEDKNTTIIDASENAIGLEISENCDYNTVSDFTIKNASIYGIHLHSETAHSGATCNFNTISNCIIRDCVDPADNHGHGIRIHGERWTCQANNNMIINCEFYNNTGFGCWIQSGTDSTSQSSGNVVLNSKIYNNKIGIAIGGSIVKDNVISNCEIYNNSLYGIYVNDVSNVFYHNNLMNNGQNAYDLGSNTWDNGYPSGGNYWDDYTGIDSDGDGIGDTPYDIPGGSNQDRYPLGIFKNPPVADFTYQPTNPKITELIEFTDASTDSDGDIVEWWWDFNDGYYSDLQNPVHIFYTAGTYDVSLTVTDDDGATDTITVSILVVSPSEEIETLIDDIVEMDLGQGLENSLTQKLMNALQSIGNGWIEDAINQLNAFINQVEAQRGNKLTEEQADYLVAEAQAIIDSL